MPIHQPTRGLLVERGSSFDATDVIGNPERVHSRNNDSRLAPRKRTFSASLRRVPPRQPIRSEQRGAETREEQDGGWIVWTLFSGRKGHASPRTTGGRLEAHGDRTIERGQDLRFQFPSGKPAVQTDEIRLSDAEEDFP